MTDQTDIPELDRIDSTITALGNSEADLLEMYRTLLPFDEGMLAVAAVKRALAGGGGGGGAASPVANMDGQAAVSISGMLNLNCQFPVAFESGGPLGVFQYLATAPPLVYPVSAVVQFTQFGVSGIDSTVSAYDAQVQVLVTNEDQTELISLYGDALANSGAPDDSANVAPSALNVLTSAGDDLSYDPDTGVVSSAAGGAYSVQVLYQGNWAD